MKQSFLSEIFHLWHPANVAHKVSALGFIFGDAEVHERNTGYHVFFKMNERENP